MAKKIRVTNGRWWYENMIGEEFDVVQTFDEYEDYSLTHKAKAYEVILDEEGPAYIIADDCEVVDEESNVPSPNMVESPPHYNSGKYEVIDIIEDSLRDIPGGFEAYMVGNIEKYVMRYRHKNGVEDLKKSRWYLDRLIVEVEKSAK
jgi:hypothetical protein